MMVATVPIIAPIMFKAGYDPVWFGIIIIILMELAMITPPVGINLYVVQGPAQARQDRRRHHRRVALRHHHAADAGDPVGCGRRSPSGFRKWRRD